MRCITIDQAREHADRLHFEEMEKRQQEYELAEDELIDDRIDNMTGVELIEAIENTEDWDSLAKLCADSGVKSDNYERLGRVVGGMIRDYAKKLVEKENV